MTDIQQWRRRVQPTRVRTPAIVDLNESEAETLPVPPRKPLRPTFTRHKSQLDVNAHSVKLPDHDWVLRRTPSWITDQPTPDPSIEELIDSLMRNFLGDLHNDLTARFSSDLMCVFEAYRHLADDKEDLLAKLQQEKDKSRSIQLAWDCEKQGYKAEVKRLELVLSQGKQGLAEVTLARQDSLLKRGQRSRATDESGLEAILEHLEKSKRYEDKTWGSQRAFMRQKSPSSKMRRLSRTLTTKASKRQGFAEVPVGTLPSGKVSFLPPTTVDYSPLISHPPQSEPRTSVSDDDTFSTFSSVGDLLPDETVDATYSMNSVGRAPVSATTQATQQVLLSRKAPTLRMKASGFLSKFRPQLTVDTGGERRFSFEAGDDSSANLSASNTHSLNTLPAGVKSRFLRKSASMSTLENMVARVMTQDPALSPVTQSPTTSTAADAASTAPESEGSQRRSKIPTPMCQRASVAAPRRERDDSSSSLMTAFRLSEDASHRSNSRPSSAFISISGSRIDLTQGLHGVEIMPASTPRTNGNHRLSDRTNALRGSALLNALAAKAANVAMQSADQSFQPGLERRSSVRSSNNSRPFTHAAAIPDAWPLQEENDRPMGAAIGGINDGDVTQ